MKIHIEENIHKATLALMQNNLSKDSVLHKDELIYKLTRACLTYARDKHYFADKAFYLYEHTSNKFIYPEVQINSHASCLSYIQKLKQENSNAKFIILVDRASNLQQQKNVEDYIDDYEAIKQIKATYLQNDISLLLNPCIDNLVLSAYMTSKKINWCLDEDEQLNYLVLSERENSLPFVYSTEFIASLGEAYNYGLGLMLNNKCTNFHIISKINTELVESKKSYIEIMHNQNEAS